MTTPGLPTTVILYQGSLGRRGEWKAGGDRVWITCPECSSFFAMPTPQNKVTGISCHFCGFSAIAEFKPGLDA